MMLSRKQSRMIAAVMLLAATGFFSFAITHPEAGFPWSNTVTYSMYAVYVLVMAILFIAPFRKKG